MQLELDVVALQHRADQTPQADFGTTHSLYDYRCIAQFVRELFALCSKMANSGQVYSQSDVADMIFTLQAVTLSVSAASNQRLKAKQLVVMSNN